MADIVTEHDWLSKMDAARLLGVQIRQLEKREKQGYIRKQTLARRMNEKTAGVRYSREDIEALKRGEPNHNGSGLVPEAKAPALAKTPDKNIEIRKAPTPAAAIAHPAGDPFAGLAAQLARLAEAFPPPAEAKPWLTLSEAAAFSGLPAAWLLGQARAGAVRAVNVGAGKRAFWRFNRADLQK